MRALVRRWPLLHFLAGGGVLFLLVGRPATAPPPAPLVIGAAEVTRLRDGYRRETGLPPTPADEVALIDRAVDEELLFREALARGLDRHDRSVRHWLIEQMRVLADDPAADEQTLYQRALGLGLDRNDLVVRRILVQKMRLLAARAGESTVDEDELRRFYRDHAGDYRQPDRVDLQQVFLRRAHDGGDADSAQRLLVGLRAGDDHTAVPAGDAFPLPRRLTGQSRAQLEKAFGAGFAAQVMSGTPGTWIGPLDSPYGAHLVRVEAHRNGAVAPFEAVRGQVLERWREQRRRERLAALLAELRRRQPLRVESAAWQQRSTT
ncbi:MAG: peptidylprolyl isomerase [Deltaproteobacteria bacterium]|nr:peptidylprolyl isomerase [Deltaproteobacteria bacterium]